MEFKYFLTVLLILTLITNGEVSRSQVWQQSKARFHSIIKSITVIENMEKDIKKSNCNCYYGGKLGCKFKKSCNFPNCRFFTTKKPDVPIDNYKEYLKIKHESIKLKNALKLKRKRND